MYLSASVVAVSGRYNKCSTFTFTFRHTHILLRKHNLLSEVIKHTLHIFKEFSRYHCQYQYHNVDTREAGSLCRVPHRLPQISRYIFETLDGNKGLIKTLTWFTTVWTMPSMTDILPDSSTHHHSAHVRYSVAYSHCCAVLLDIDNSSYYLRFSCACHQHVENADFTARRYFKALYMLWLCLSVCLSHSSTLSIS